MPTPESSDEQSIDMPTTTDSDSENYLEQARNIVLALWSGNADEIEVEHRIIEWNKWHEVTVRAHNEISLNRAPKLVEAATFATAELNAMCARGR